MARKPKSIVGKRFGRLIVTEDSGGRNSKGEVLWNCCCECGNKVTVRTSNLTTSHTRSCGCLAKDVRQVYDLCQFIQSILIRAVESGIKLPQFGQW
jgi:hypothetical protein